MEATDLEQLDALLHKLREDTRIMEGLSILERQAIVGASQTICSLVRKHLNSSAPRPATDTK
jgi:hypothetical protein